MDIRRADCTLYTLYTYVYKAWRQICEGGRRGGLGKESFTQEGRSHGVEDNARSMEIGLGCDQLTDHQWSLHAVHGPSSQAKKGTCYLPSRMSTCMQLWCAWRYPKFFTNKGQAMLQQIARWLRRRSREGVGWSGFVWLDCCMSFA